MALSQFRELVRTQDADGTRIVRVRLDDDFGLTFEGQDFGPGVRRLLGTDEYEYWLRLDQQQMMHLMEVLGERDRVVNAEVMILDAVGDHLGGDRALGLRTWFDERGVTYTFTNRRS